MMRKGDRFKIGDKIVFLKRPELKETIKVKVVGLSIFGSFKDLFQIIGKTKFGYKKDDALEDQILCMRKYYSEEEEQKFGVVGIHLRLIGNQEQLLPTYLLLATAIRFG